MLNWLWGHFRKAQLYDCPLEFTLDLDDQGKHVVEVYAVIDGQKEKIKDIRKVWNYGYILKRSGKQYVISTKSLTTLLSLRSLNPAILDDGSKMVFDVHPSLLRYWRAQGGIKELVRSKELEISDKPLKPGSKVDYKPDIGLTVETGYRQEGTDELIALRDLNVTPDGSYIKLHNTFFPFPQDIDPTIKQWLDVGRVNIPPDSIPEFFKRDLVLLKTKLGAVITESAMMIRIVDKRFKPRIQASLNKTDWLDFKVGYVVGEYELPYDISKKTKEKYAHPDDYTWIRMDNETIQKTEKYLHELGAEEITGGFRIPIMQFASLEEFIKQIGGIREVAIEYQRFLDEITDFQSNENFVLPEEMETRLTSEGISLRPYQRAGIHWLNWLMDHHLHGILADDMGLGKTIQTVAAICIRYRKREFSKHSLIVCPKSVVHFWTREIERCFPEARVYEYIGNLRNKNLWKDPEPIIFVTTYETIVRDISIIRSIPFYFVVLDEATKIKNPNTNRSRAIKSINSFHRIALTGTPIENRPAELWSLFDFLMKGHLGTYERFVRLFEGPIMAGNEDTTHQLSNRIRPFVLRRLKEDVAKDLPRKIEIEEWCDLTDEQKFLYGRLLPKGEDADYVSILSIIAKLKQVCDHPALITGEADPIDGRSEKFDLVVKKVEDIRSAGERVVVFSHFLRILDLLEIAFRDRGINYIRLDGSTTNRQIYIDQFNNSYIDAALISIQACGHGINITAANHVIHVDRWWNPAVEDQATDRVHRIGQDKTVYVYRILVKGTLEEKIALLLERKRSISDKVVNATTGQEMRWTREELLELLKPLD